MNVTNIAEELENSHQRVLQVLNDLPESEWDVPGVSGEWSVKDVVAHLTSYELALLDALATFKGQEPTPYVRRLFAAPEEFDAAGVEARRYHTAQQVMDEYQDAQLRSSSVLASLPAAQLYEPGRLPWYRKDASLADLIHRFSAHTREQSERIARFHHREDTQGPSSAV